MPISRLTILLLTLFCSAPIFAVDLYSGEVQVGGHGPEERNQAVPSALIQVLQKQSGRREMPLGQALDSALLSANRIMVSSHYNNKERAAPDGSVDEELWLVANFLPAAVDRILRDLGLPLWRQERQPVSVWVVVDDGLGRRVQPVEYQYAWDALGDIAELRGLPVSWPELGESPDEQADLQLLWGGFTEQLIDQAAPGGGALIIAARRIGPEWNIRWNFSDGGETDGWRNRDQDLSSALAEGMHRLADLVAARNSIAAGALGKWRQVVDIGGIHGSPDYERCLAYLQGLSLVSGVEIEAASPGEVRFVLDLNASPEYLVESLGRDGVLQAGLAENRFVLLPEDGAPDDASLTEDPP